MCTVFLPPGDNPIAVNKYIYQMDPSLYQLKWVKSLASYGFWECWEGQPENCGFDSRRPEGVRLVTFTQPFNQRVLERPYQQWRSRCWSPQCRREWVEPHLHFAQGVVLIGNVTKYRRNAHLYETHFNTISPSAPWSCPARFPLFYELHGAKSFLIS